MTVSLTKLMGLLSWFRKLFRRRKPEVEKTEWLEITERIKPIDWGGIEYRLRKARRRPRPKPKARFFKPRPAHEKRLWKPKEKPED